MEKTDKFDKLYKESKNKLYNVAFSVVKNREMAEDVLIDSMTKAWKKFDEYDQSKKFLNWMTTIVKNTAIDHVRKKSKTSNTYSFDNPNMTNKQNSQITSIELEDKRLDLYQNYERNEIMQELLISINDLPGELRTVMIPLFENYSYQEISERTTLTIPTVRARVHKAKKILRQTLNHENFAIF